MIHYNEFKTLKGDNFPKGIKSSIFKAELNLFKYECTPKVKPTVVQIFSQLRADVKSLIERCHHFDTYST